MRFEGYLEKNKSDKYWGVNIPCFGIYTQGKTKKKAYEMAKDAIESLVDENIQISISASKDHLFFISSNKLSPLISLLLKQKRMEKGLTIMEIAKRLGSKSPTSYARYESGKVQPSLDKLDQILKAIDSDLEPILKIS